VKGMTRGITHRSEAAAAVYETAVGLFEASLINKQTMREFDEVCRNRETGQALTDMRDIDTPDADTLADDN
jgi:DNA-binding transcriptional regulator YiaG